MNYTNNIKLFFNKDLTEITSANNYKYILVDMIHYNTIEQLIYYINIEEKISLRTEC